MITRADYMANSATLHQAYYAEVAADARLTIRPDLLARVVRSTDPHLNDIPLAVWDNISLAYQSSLSRAFKARGDFWSLAGGCCAAKAQARVQLAQVD
jgi:hypothetical protein